MKPPRAGRRVRIESQVLRSRARRGRAEQSPHVGTAPDDLLATMQELARAGRQGDDDPRTPPPASSASGPAAHVVTASRAPSVGQAAEGGGRLPSASLRVAVLTSSRIAHLVGECGWTRPGLVPQGAVTRISGARWHEMRRGQVEPTGAVLCSICAQAEVDSDAGHVDLAEPALGPANASPRDAAADDETVGTAAPVQAAGGAAQEVGGRTRLVPIEPHREQPWPDTLARQDVEWLAAHLRLAGAVPPWRSIATSSALPVVP